MIFKIYSIWWYVYVTLWQVKKSCTHSLILSKLNHWEINVDIYNYMIVSKHVLLHI